MTAPTTLAPPVVSQPHVTLRGREIPVVLPNRPDPRLKLSAVIMTLHVLGQTVLGFKVSIAQIAISIAVCAAVEAAVSFRSQRILVWPASGILTGSSVAFILRASGTPHGDWWSLRGIQFLHAGRADLAPVQAPDPPRRAAPVQPVERGHRVVPAGDRAQPRLRPVPSTCGGGRTASGWPWPTP